MSLPIREVGSTNRCKVRGGLPNSGQRSCTDKTTQASGSPGSGSTWAATASLCRVAWCILRLKNELMQTLATNHRTFLLIGRCCNERGKCVAKLFRETCVLDR